MSGPAAFFGMSAAFLVAMVAVSAWAARQLPDDGPVPVHFDLRGNPNKFGSRWLVLGLLPVCYVLLTALLLWIGANAPETEVEPAEILTGHGLASVLILAAHGFIAFLLLRWARQR